MCGQQPLCSKNPKRVGKIKLGKIKKVCVTGYLSPRQTTTATAQTLPLHSRLVCPNPKPKTYFKTQKIFNKFQEKGVLSFANFSDTFFDQKSPIHAVWVAVRGNKQWQTKKNIETHIATYRLYGPWGRFSGNSVYRRLMNLSMCSDSSTDKKKKSK